MCYRPGSVSLRLCVKPPPHYSKETPHSGKYVSWYGRTWRTNTYAHELWESLNPLMWDNLMAHPILALLTILLISLVTTRVLQLEISLIHLDPFSHCCILPSAVGSKVSTSIMTDRTDGLLSTSGHQYLLFSFPTIRQMDTWENCFAMHVSILPDISFREGYALGCLWIIFVLCD